MSKVHRIHLGYPALLEFRGPDTLRYLNGQLTQDVRRLAGSSLTLPSCVTDAKGRLQFRVWITESNDGAIRVEGPADSAEIMEAWLTRYLIADDVDVSDLTGKWSLVHFTGPMTNTPPGVMARASERFGMAGTDWWIPAGLEIEFPADAPMLDGEPLEAFRIAQGIPAWGRELTEGLLPPEAGLEATDISYQKGCYIGQEVISRIKSAGKVNRRLVRLSFDATAPAGGLSLVNPEGNTAGELTSVSPLADDSVRHALGYVKRGTTDVIVMSADGTRYPASIS